MNAAFFGLAFTAAINPKLLAIDLILLETRRPRLMFICFLIGGMGLSVALGILDVTVLHVHAINTQGQLSATLDIVLGVLLLAIGSIVLTGRVGRPQRAAAGTAGRAPKKEKEGWAERVLRDPRPALVVVVGALAGTPGASYITAMRDLTTGKSSTGSQIVGVVLFNVIMFSPVLIPLFFLETQPEATKAKVKRVSTWLGGHVRQLVAGVALLLGAYMAISGLIRIIT